MASTLQKIVIFLNLVALACCISTADKDEPKISDIDAEETQDDLEPQETGWIFNPLQDKARTLEYLKDKVFYPFSALKSPGSFGSNYPIYTSGASHSYSPWGYPSYAFAGSNNYFPSPKPKQYYNYSPGWSYKKPYPSYPYKTWYNKNYYSTGGYQVNTATYTPDCFYPSSGSSFPTSTASPPSYSSGTPLYYHYSSVTPSQAYGVPGISFGAKTAINVPSTPSPIPFSSHFNPTDSQGPPNTYSFRVSSPAQYFDNSAQISGLSPALPANYATFSSSLPSFTTSTYSPPSFSSVPTTPTPFSSVVSTTPTPTFSQSSVPSGSSSSPIPIAYNQGDEGISEEIIITPPSQSTKGHYVTTLPGPKIALPEPSLYNQPPQYAVAYYPNVFYITNEQRLEKTSSTQSTGTQEVPGDGTVVVSSESSTPSTASQSTMDGSIPSTKSHQSAAGLPGPGLTTFYSSQYLDQTRIPVPSAGQFVAPQTPGGFYYSAIVPSEYNGGSYSSLPHEAVPLTNSIPTLSYPFPLSYGQPQIGYHTTRTSKNC